MKTCSTYLILIALLLFGCNTGQNDTSEKQLKNEDSLATHEHVTNLEAHESLPQYDYIFEEHQVLTKMHQVLLKENVRNIQNSLHEEYENQLVYSKDFGLTESMDVEYHFDTTDFLLDRIVIVSYHETPEQRNKFYNYFLSTIAEEPCMVEQSNKIVNIQCDSITIEITRPTTDQVYNTEIAINKSNFGREY